MKKFAAFLLIILCALLFWQQSKKKNPPFPHVAFIPIEKYTTSALPCFYIELEKRSVLAELDLGMKRCVVLDQALFESLSEKSFSREEEMISLNGKSQPMSLSFIAPIQIGPLTFHHLEAGIKDQNYYADSDLFVGSNGIDHPPCTLGWSLFSTSNLVLDFRRHQIGFSDDLETLNTHLSDKFISTPLLEHDDFLEIQVLTDSGPLRCILDTGCTWNMIQSDLKSDVFETEELKISGVNFGPTQFHPWKIDLPNRVDAILGMEFLYNQTCFIDFAKKSVYFSR